MPSPITLRSSDLRYPPLRYIAMQGPTKPSFDHVWRMVAEQTSSSPAVIVQLTEMADKHGRKCDQYLPMAEEGTAWRINDDNIWGDNWKAYLTFHSLEIIAGGAIEKRMLVLHIDKEGEKEEARIIWHFLYKRWPDYGVPTADDINSLLKLIKLSKQYSSPNSKCIVHCSAGVGRTELDFGILKKHDSMWVGPDLIYKAVDILRQQRWGMVQTEEQYRFIYQVMRKLWYNKYGVADEKAGNNK
ncbi:hypothetical protein CI102_3552 [Trichoderma harzianum]|nr:hypothetical protein CI102_3552 [Trichoderma harzianum]